MKQLTAVEILNDKISIHLNFDQRLYLKEAFLKSQKIFEEQFKYSFTKGMGFCEIYGSPEEEVKQDKIAKQLNNATFKQQEQ
jgi:hypothetical protein